MIRIFRIIICFFIVIQVSMAEDSSLCDGHHCLVIIDAGSTGSRLHLYSYDVDNKNNPTQVKERYSNKITPGFSTIEVKPDAINTYLDRLFLNLPQKEVSVYFYATGGMRLVAPSVQQAYYQLLQNWFASKPQWRLADFRTISGTEEGVFGWLSVNYQLDLLGSNNKQLTSLLDIGGASTQIVFPVLHTENIDKEDLISLEVNGRHISLFAHSFLGLGMTEVAKRFQNLAECFPTGYLLPNNTVALGNAYSCDREISESINAEYGVSGRVKAIVEKKNPADSWYMLGAVSALVKSTPLAFGRSPVTSQELLQQADSKVCHPEWVTLKAQFPDNEYLLTNCLTAAYYHSLTVNGYGFLPNQAVNYMPDSNESDWTLGVVLNQATPRVFDR